MGLGVVIGKQNECHKSVTRRAGIAWVLGLPPEQDASLKKRPARAGQLEFWLGCERSCGVATNLMSP